jgi:imidazolonepropionase-like amidohydrolase
VAFYEDEQTKMSERIGRLPKFLREAWKPEHNVQLKERTPASIESERKLQARLIALVGAMNKGGVRLLAGTGSGGTPLCVPGESLHEELELLVKAGLTPAQALRTATSNPAEFLGLSKKLGSVEVGKDADLVLLSADPLADIRNTSKVDSVVLHGRLMSKERLAQATEFDEATPQDAAKQK